MRASLLLFAVIGCQPAGSAPSPQDDDTPKRLKRMEETLDQMGETMTVLHEEVAGLRDDMGGVLSKLEGAGGKLAETPESPEPLDVSGIHCADKACTVPLGLVLGVLEHPEVLMRQAPRVVPSQRDGRTVGYKLFGIRRGSIPAALGIENGDLVWQSMARLSTASTWP